MQDIQNKVEAVLFTVGKFLTIEEIAKACGIGSPGIIKDTLNSLKKKYENEDTPLMLEEKDSRYKLTLKKQYLPLTQKLVSESEFDRPTQETLAIIAYKNPVLQSEVVKIRGNMAYDHIKLLREQSLITSEKKGRTRLLKIAPAFYDYFDIIEDQLKSKFSGIKINEKLEKQIIEAKEEFVNLKKEAENVKKKNV